MVTATPAWACPWRSTTEPAMAPGFTASLWLADGLAARSAAAVGAGDCAHSATAQPTLNIANQHRMILGITNLRRRPYSTVNAAEGAIVSFEMVSVTVTFIVYLPGSSDSSGNSFSILTC